MPIFQFFYQTEERLLSSQLELNKMGIFPRRYFYPSLSELPYLTHVQLNVSESLSKRVFCLPLSHDFDQDITETIANVINKG